MTILAFGCSVTHGADLVHPNQHEDNVKYSYPNLIANTLGVPCLNYAQCGMSNEGIFHKFLNTMRTWQSDDVTAVIVCWTSTMREYWRADDRDWYIISSWCATSKNNRPLKYFKDYTDADININPRVCADESFYMEPLSQMYNLITRYKFDHMEYLKKKLNYVEQVKLYCNMYNLKLIETCCIDFVPGIDLNLDNFGHWRQGLGHPTRQDHEQIAQHILLSYER